MMRSLGKPVLQRPVSNVGQERWRFFFIIEKATYSTCTLDDSHHDLYRNRNSNYVKFQTYHRQQRQQQQFRILITSPYKLLTCRTFVSSSTSPTIEAAKVREQLLHIATTELQRVKEYYQSDEYNNSNSTNRLDNSSVTLQSTPTILENSSDVQDYMQRNNIDTVLFDCDGVLYRSPHPTPDAAMALRSLIQQQKKYVLFVTNNGSVSRTQLRRRLMDFLQLSNDEDKDLLSDDMMISSAYASAEYLKQQQEQLSSGNDNSQHVFCIGSEGLCNEIANAGFVVTHANDETISSMSRDDLAHYDFHTLLQKNTTKGKTKNTINPSIDAVVIGHDSNFTYRKLCIATVLLQWNPNALLIATNMDAYDLTGTDGRHLPGNGALVAAVEYGTHRKAINVGKPSRTLLELIQSTQKHRKFDASRSLFVGDRLDTDIRFGYDHNMKTILVLSGVTNTNVLRRIHTGTIEEPLPSAIMSHVGLMALTES